MLTKVYIEYSAAWHTREGHGCKIIYLAPCVSLFDKKGQSILRESQLVIKLDHAAVRESTLVINKVYLSYL